VKISQLAQFVKSGNAGATHFTFDIGFDRREVFEHVYNSGVVSKDAIARIYGISSDVVQTFAYYPSLTIKITIPRPTISGGAAERDFDGTQQFAPLLDLDVPDAPTGR
jgi:hypothetical protein